MLRKALAALAVVLALAAPARADFVLNGTSLTTNKQDLFPTPIGANPLNYITAADYNAVSQAAIDLRSAITGVTGGFVLKLGDGSAVGTCVSGQGWVRYNNSTHVLEQCVNGGSWAGFGGGSTGNWTFSGNNADLSGAGSMGLGLTTATGMTIGHGGGTGSFALTLALQQVLLGNSSGDNTPYIYNNGNYYAVSQPATSGATLQSATSYFARGAYWNGTTSVVYDMAIQGVMDSTAPASHLSCKFNGAEKFQFTSAGNLFIVPGQVIGNISQGTAGSAGVGLQGNVADGAGSTAITLNTSVSMANATAKIVSMLNAGVEKFQFIAGGNFNLTSGSTIGAIAQGATNTTGLIIAPNVAAGASSIALQINAPTAMTVSGGGHLIDIANAGTTIGYLQEDTTNNGVKWFTRSSYSWIFQAAVSNQFYSTAADGVSALNLAVDTNNPWSNPGAHLAKFSTNGTEMHGINAGGQPDYAVGTAITAATTIAPTKYITHITGTTAIATITAPTSFATSGLGGQIVLIPDAAFTTTTGGNIALATTAVVSKALTMTYDNATSKWYPSY